jgi:selenide,water dikinase
VTLVSPQDFQLYSGMVPGHVAGHYTRDQCAMPLATLAMRAGVRFLRTHAVLVDPARREITLADGGELAYDVLSLDIGSQPFTGGVAGVERHAIAVRPLDAMLENWARVHARASRGELRSITMVGGGAAGVELALAMDHRLKETLGGGAPHVRIVADSREPLPELAHGIRARATLILAKARDRPALRASRAGDRARVRARRGRQRVRLRRDLSGAPAPPPPSSSAPRASRPMTTAISSRTRPCDR